MKQSPLLEAQAASLDELFAEDPLELDDERLQDLISVLRSYRETVATKRGERTAKRQAREALSIDDDTLTALLGGEVGE